MPDVGRFFNIDPLSEKYAYQSHYNFSENKVTSHRELEGLEAAIPVPVTPVPGATPAGAGRTVYGNPIGSTISKAIEESKVLYHYLKLLF